MHATGFEGRVKVTQRASPVRPSVGRPEVRFKPQTFLRTKGFSLDAGPDLWQGRQPVGGLRRAKASLPA